MNALNNLIGPDIAEILDQRRYDQLRGALVELEPADIADLVSGLDGAQAAVVFRLLPRDLATDVFEYLNHEQQQALIENLTTDRVRLLINEMDPDDRTALLEELPAEVAHRLIALLNAEERRVTQAILGYPEESIGRLMTPDYIAVRPDFTIKQVLDHIRRFGRDAETINVIYVIDENGRLIDDLHIRQLLLADPEQTVESLMDGKFVTLQATEDREVAVRKMQHYDRVALPVVDSRGMLVGIVTADDVADVAEAEVTEDIQKMSGMEALDTPYLESPLRHVVRKRGGWLSMLFIGEMFTATAMSYFEGELEKAVVLALFIPLIISSGGNAGSQATSLVIRAMTTGEVTLHDWWRVLFRELAAGIALGAVLGTIVLGRIWFWPNNETLYGEHYMMVGVVVALSLESVVLFGTIVGSMLPFILRFFSLDPAAASAPFVATLVDVSGIIIYFNIASLLLRGTVL